MISRPAAFNSVAIAAIALVGAGLTRARRAARKDLTSPYLQRSKLRQLTGGPPRCEAIRCRDLRRRRTVPVPPLPGEGRDLSRPWAPAFAGETRFRYDLPD